MRKGVMRKGRTMRQVRLPGGERVAALGQGTWMMGDDAASRADETAALRRGLDLGLTLIDTAEMYGAGASETLIGEALAGRRDAAFLVSKALPSHAGRAGLERACGASLRRLKTDRLDLYLLHWRGAVPLAETVAGMEALKAKGMVRHWGVSNFDTDDMEELWAAGGEGCSANQVLYNLARRGPEFDLLPWQASRGVPAMAYSPIEQGRLKTAALKPVAEKHGVAPYAVALAWAMRAGDVIAIPKAGRIAHVEANARAADLKLDADDCAALDKAFLPPRRKVALEMI
jgi:diketogulonate reductase-like aldo/keto reductase